MLAATLSTAPNAATMGTSHALPGTCSHVLASPASVTPVGNTIGNLPCGFQVGNDFLPAIPSLDIYDNPTGLDVVMTIYRVRGSWFMPATSSALLCWLLHAAVLI